MSSSVGQTTSQIAQQISNSPPGFSDKDDAAKFADGVKTNNTDEEQQAIDDDKKKNPKDGDGLKSAQQHEDMQRFQNDLKAAGIDPSKQDGKLHKVSKDQGEQLKKDSDAMKGDGVSKDQWKSFNSPPAADSGEAAMTSE